MKKVPDQSSWGKGGLAFEVFVIFCGESIHETDLKQNQKVLAAKERKEHERSLGFGKEASLFFVIFVIFCG